ncbi:MAG: helix-turn-helix domain-containing protein [Pseudolabrys sp.]|jgi:predicted DNA-binding transcriptional regulator AlpA
MTSQNSRPIKTGAESGLLTATDAATFLRLSPSWLAKARRRGDGPPYVKIGRSVRYDEGTLAEWTKSHLRLSTHE